MSAPAAATRSSARRPPALREVWRFRGLLRALVVRNLKVKYQRSALGFVWTLLNPLLTVAVLAAVFSFIVRIPVPRYWAFLVSGYFVWNFLTMTLTTGTYIIAEHAALRRSVAFPAEVLVLAAALSRFLEFAVEMAFVLLALAVLHHHGVPAAWALLPVLLALQLLLAVGLVLPVATLSVFYTDAQHALPIVLVMLFYASPVFYPAALVPAAVRDAYFLNPLAGLLTLFHAVLYEGRVPPPGLLAAVALVSLAVCTAGYALFNRHKAVFAEIV